MPTCPEGTYTTWFYLGKVLVDAPDPSDNALFVDNSGNMYWYTESPVDDTVTIYNKSFQQVWDSFQFGCIPSIPAGGSAAMYNPQSTCKIYTVLWKCSTNRLFLLKSNLEDPSSPPDWLPLWIRKMVDDYANVANVYFGSISPNGKYIVVLIEDTSGDFYLMLYEGS